MCCEATIKTNFILGDTLEKITSLAFRGYADSALGVLNKSELNEEQKLKIAAILQGPLPDYTIEAAQTLKQRISAVISKDGIVPTDTSATAPSINSTSVADFAAPVSSSQITPINSEQEKVFSFTDSSTSPFAMDYPCSFEFEGNHFTNATACFLAQQYTDQAEMMNLFTTLGSEEASALAELTPMIKERKLTCENPDAKHVNKDDVLMYVQRAKFGQNPELKKELLETGSAYLVCKGYGRYFADNFNGTGANALGISLMRLRGEYGGAALVAKPAIYLGQAESQQERNYNILNEIPEDVVGLFFKICIDQSDWQTLTVFPCLNKRWNRLAANFGEGLDLKQLCPELIILDAQTQGVKCDDEPKVSKLTILKGVKKLAPHVEENAGVTLLTMTKDTTLNQLIQIAKGAGIAVDYFTCRHILQELGDVPIGQTYIGLVTNNVFVDSRNKAFDLQKKLVEEHRCEMPTVQEYVALCVFTNKIFKNCLYGKNPLTFGRSSTHVHHVPLIVGGSTLSCIDVTCSELLATIPKGAGGWRKF